MTTATGVRQVMGLKRSRSVPRVVGIHNNAFLWFFLLIRPLEVQIVHLLLGILRWLRLRFGLLLEGEGSIHCDFLIDRADFLVEA